MEVSGIIETIMADASWFGIKVSDKSMYGDVANTKMDTYKKFDLVKQSEIDNPEAAKKSYIDVAGNNWTPSLNNTYTTGKDGKVVITNGTLSTHDADGNPIALTEDEAKELLATGYVTYTYTDIHGNVIEKIEGEDGLPGKPGNVIKTLNIDWDKTGVAQNVTVIITISDGQGLSGLLALVNALLPMFIPGFAPVEIPGAMVETSITLANVA